MILLFITLFFGYSHSHKQHRSDSTICHQPQQMGSCRGALPRFWYNDKSNKCEEFVYGGCNGNENNFLKESDCVKACIKEDTNNTPVQRRTDANVCLFPKMVGPCRASKRRFWYNFDEKKCEVFMYGGCDGNDNNFLTENDCLKICFEGTEKEALVPYKNPNDRHRNIEHDENNASMKKIHVMMIFAVIIIHVILYRF